jgi:type II secretory pathway predicted ATPase ExeA
MYEPFFGLNRRPFAAAADADCYFPATAIETARQTLFRAIDRGEGPGLLIGPAGSGKSLLLMVLSEQFGGRFEIARLANGGLGTRRELLQAILYELGLPCRELDEGELRLSLIDFLSETGRQQTFDNVEREGLLLLIDEAHTLSYKLLEETRLITNLIRDGQPKVRLVLAGSALLEERFASPKLDTFNQRIAARTYLQAIDRGETFEYVKAQIAWAGGQPERLFTTEALAAVHQATQGVPRLINQVCDHALLLSCAAGNATIGKSAVEEAWADLQQLPTPWNRQSGPTSAEPQAGPVIEFGVLGDDDDDDEKSLGGHGSRQAPVCDQDKDPNNEEWGIEIEVNEDASVVDDVFQDSSVELSFDEMPPSQAFASPELSDSVHSVRQNPLGRLALVEEQLAAIDIDIGGTSHTGIGGPHLGVSFDTAVNPFAEQFAEEEVILDPFAMTAGDALANRPLVQSEEGRTLGALLRPLPGPATPKLSITPSDCTLDITQDNIEIEPVLRTVDADGSYRSWTDANLADDASSEPALIVIEDDPPPVHHVTVVRRTEYGQAFGNLRRG